MSFGIYLIGYVVMIIGLSLGAYFLHLQPRWIAVGVIVLIGIGILHGVTATRTRDVS